VLGVISLAGLVLLVLYAFVVSPADAALGESVRIMYVHVPTVAAAYFLMLANAGFSVWAIWKRSEFADLAAHACAEVGVLMLGLTLVGGAIWGRMTWGAFWVWDARLTTTALLFLLYLGYLAVRGLPAETRTRAVRSGVMGIAAAALIPVVHKSVDWWQSLHQKRTAFGTLDPTIHGTQYFTLMLGMVVFLVLSVWLVMHRFRLAWLVERARETGLEGAIAARRAEGVTS
jgi:heme exporter protein C